MPLGALENDIYPVRFNCTVNRTERVFPYLAERIFQIDAFHQLITVDKIHSVR